jgi:hypothetical protein
MASTFSPYKIELMATGENNTTWGDKTNVNFTAFEELITGSADVAFASANVTLTLTDTSAPQTARNLRLNLTGVTGGVPRNLIVPALEKFYLVKNGCADAITVKNATGTGIAVPAGASMAVFNDGVNVVEPITFITSPTFGTPLTVPQGGTGVATLTGLVKGNGAAAFSVAVAGTDYVAPTVATNFTATQTFTGTAAVPAMKVVNGTDLAAANGAALTGTFNFDISAQSVLYFFTAPVADWIINFRGSSGTTFNTFVPPGEVVTAVFVVAQGATTFKPSAIQVDGTAASVTVAWQGGTQTAPTASTFAVYSFVIRNGGAGAYTIFASMTRFG